MSELGVATEGTSPEGTLEGGRPVGVTEMGLADSLEMGMVVERLSLEVHGMLSR